MLTMHWTLDNEGRLTMVWIDSFPEGVCAIGRLPFGIGCRNTPIGRMPLTQTESQKTTAPGWRRHLRRAA